MTTAPKNNSPNNYSKDLAISEFTTLLNSGQEFITDIKKLTSLEEAKKKYERWITNVCDILKNLYKDNYFVNLFKDACIASVNIELDNPVDICKAIESGIEFLEDRIRFLNLYGDYPDIIHLEPLCKKMIDNLKEVFPEDILAGTGSAEIKKEIKKDDNEWKKKHNKLIDEGKNLEVADSERKEELLKNPKHLIILLDSSELGKLNFTDYDTFIDEINDHKSWFEKEFVKRASTTLLTFLPEWIMPIPEYEHDNSIQSFNKLSSYLVDLIYLVDNLRNRILQERQKEEAYSEIDKQLKDIEKKFFNVLPEDTFNEIGTVETILYEASRLEKKGISKDELSKMSIDEICKRDKSVRYFTTTNNRIGFTEFEIIHDNIRSIWAELDVVKEGYFRWVTGYKSLTLCNYRPEDHKQIYQRNVSDEDLRHLTNDVTQGIKTVRIFLIYSKQKTVRPELFNPLIDKSPISPEINFNKNDIHYTHVEKPSITFGISQSEQKKEDIADFKEREMKTDKDNTDKQKKKKEGSTKKKRSTLSPKAIKEIKPLSLPEEPKWCELVVGYTIEGCNFVIDNVHINVEDQYRSYKEMGFESQSPKGVPVKEWKELIGQLAANKGKIYIEKTDLYLPDMVHRANERLKILLTTDEPLILYEDSDKRNPFYYSKFRIFERQ